MGAQTLTATYIELADSADYYIKHERWDDAERVIVRALKHEPANKSNFLLWNNLGLVRSHLNRYEESINAFDIGLASAPLSTTLLSNRGRVKFENGSLKEALSDMTSALDIDSLLSFPRKIRGVIYTMNGDLKAARSDFEFYIRHNAQDILVIECLGDIESADNNHLKALDFYNSANKIETSPQLIEKLLREAILCDKYDDYLAELNSAINKWPEDGNLYLIRALIHKMKYQTADMEKDIARARENGISNNAINALLRK